MPTERTALLIRGSREEAEKIREMAERECRTVRVEPRLTASPPIKTAP